MAAATTEKIVETTKLTLPQMVDISINSGEAGLVNFNLLHALLHVIIKQCNLTNTQVEFRGSDGAKLKKFIQCMPKGAPQLTLTEYLVADDTKVAKTTGGTKKGAADTQTQTEAQKEPQKAMVKEQVVEMSDKLKREISKQEVTKEKLLKVIKRRKSSKEEINPDPEPLKEASPSLYSLDKLIVVEQTGKELPQFSVAMTKSQFENMEKEISDLRAQVKELAEMPTNAGLIGAIRKSNEEGASPILDLFQILTLAKRLDAAEVNMEKLASMVTDIAKSMAGVEGVFDDITKSGEVGVVTGADGRPSVGNLRQLEERVDEIERILSEGGDVPKKKKKRSTEEGSSEEIISQEDAVVDAGTDAEGAASASEMRGVVSVIEGIDLSKLPVKKAMSLIQQELQNVRSMLEMYNIAQMLEELEKLKDQMGGGGDEEKMPADVRLKKIENKFAECQEQLNSLDTMYNHQMNILQTQLQDVEKELAATLEKLNTGFTGGGDTGGEHSVLELYDRLVKLQDEVNTIAESMEGLLQEKSTRDLDLNAVVEQIELLKTIKADREDLEDALADKADACAVNRKVSYSQFNATFDDLSRGIDEAISKLSQQEALWKTALTDIQMEMERKMNKQELAPLKDFINERLKNLQEKFKTLTALKKEHEAAGTKSKFLRNVNCISCDKDVVMRKEMDASLMPQAPTLPPSRSMGPYLAYELDQLRKQQKCLPKGKNLHYVEDALSAKQPTDKDHICNRYCGGSHTVTTPQQRVTRIGHFLQQYGPEISPLSETMVKGADGHMYKGREPIPPECALNKDDLTTQAATRMDSAAKVRSGSTAQEAKPSASKEVRLSASKEPAVSPSKEVRMSASKEPVVSASREARLSGSREPVVSASREARLSSSKEPVVSASREARVSGSKEPVVSASREARVSGSKEPVVSASREARMSASKEAKLSPSQEVKMSPSKEPAVSPSKEAKMSTSKELRQSASKEPVASASKEAKVSASREAKISGSKDPVASPSKDLKTSASKEPVASQSKEAHHSPSATAKAEGAGDPSKNVSFTNKNEAPVRDTDEEGGEENA